MTFGADITADIMSACQLHRDKINSLEERLSQLVKAHNSLHAYLKNLKSELNLEEHVAEAVELKIEVQELKKQLASLSKSRTLDLMNETLEAYGKIKEMFEVFEQGLGYNEMLATALRDKLNPEEKEETKEKATEIDEEMENIEEEAENEGG